MSGWVKLHRQFRESSFYGQPIPVALWVECLLRASHEGKDRFIGREKVHLEPGQFVMGYREMGEAAGCGTATVKAWMDAFEKEGMVERSSNAKGTICKLKKWTEYQDTRTDAERTRNGRGTLTEPNKNEKNVKNEKKESVVASNAPTPSQEARRFFDDDERREEIIRKLVAAGYDQLFIRTEIKKFCHYWTERNKSGTKQRWETEQTFEVRRRLATWLERSTTFPKKP